MLACRSNTAPGSREGESMAGGHTGKQQSDSGKNELNTMQVCLCFWLSMHKIYGQGR